MGLPCLAASGPISAGKSSHMKLKRNYYLRPLTPFRKLLVPPSLLRTRILAFVCPSRVPLASATSNALVHYTTPLIASPKFCDLSWAMTNGTTSKLSINFDLIGGREEGEGLQENSWASLTGHPPSFLFREAWPSTPCMP